MGRYNLERLGWFQFERLIQGLLKSEISLAIESWGGTSDFGRDAYCPQPLYFPHRGKRSPGPFIFQIKFVMSVVKKEQESAIRQAINLEIVQIKKRIREKKWKSPKQYVFITNAYLSASVRKSLQRKIAASLKKSGIVIWGKSDVEDLLFSNEIIRRAYPELLGIQDLKILISDAVNKEIIKISDLAIDDATSLSEVFVATDAYHQAISVLRRHNFVVLDGPPEMGKTAIARMVALQKLLDDYQVIECREPDDVFKVLGDSPRQIFIADDAFGRTEFDISLGHKWEKSLPLLLRKLGAGVQIIWTSRKHILERALSDLDLANLPSTFPRPNEVIVDATKLTIKEKALILYRHAKRWCVDSKDKSLIQNIAYSLVASEHFTPERIRRFTEERLREFAERFDSMERSSVNAEILEAIKNPTKRMKSAFTKLTDIHQWLLVSLIDLIGPVSADELTKKAFSFFSKYSLATYKNALDELNGTFIQVRQLEYGAYRHESVQWIHPSYRDLVIDILSEEHHFQTTFLKNCSISGIKLALSESGGTSGDRILPILEFPDSWEVLKSRLIAIFDAGSAYEQKDVFEALLGAFKLNLSEEKIDDYKKIRDISSDIVDRFEAKLSSRYLSDVDLIVEYCKLAVALDREPRQGAIDAVLTVLTRRIRATIDEGRDADFDVFISYYMELSDVLVAQVELLRIDVSIVWSKSISKLFNVISEYLSKRAPSKDRGYDDDEAASMYVNWATCEESTKQLRQIFKSKTLRNIKNCSMARQKTFDRPSDENDDNNGTREEAGEELTLNDVPKLFVDL